MKSNQSTQELFTKDMTNQTINYEENSELI